MASITNNTSQLYRITYEAYSKFANNISRCTSLKEVGEISRTHLKYLLNFHIIRLSIQEDDKYLFFSIAGNQVIYDLKEQTQILNHEKDLLENEIPLLTKDIPHEWIDEYMESNQLIEPSLWGWLFKKNERKIAVTLISDKNKPFNTGDVDILKLVVDCFEAKFHEIYLSRLLAIKNKSLTKALNTIQEKNDQIQKIVENQQQIIEDRTKEIVEKNKKLLHISAINAHNVREPLSRIQGLIQLFDLFDDQQIRTEVIPKLEKSAEEMDHVLQDVINMATNELSELKAERT